MIGMRGSCAAKYPKLLAGDAITEFVLDHRAESFPGLALDYMSSASGVAWGPECAVAKKQPFFPLYRKYGFGPDCDTGQAVRAMFGWDALHTLEAAAVRVNDLHSDPLAPGAMLHGLDSLTGRDAVNGVTGRIAYSSSGATPQAPVDKAILVVGTDEDGLPFRQMLCGNIPTADEPDAGCPTG
jgi:hypothetical protein